MSEETSGEGKCVCGAVTLKVAKVSKSAGACHCTTCRNWGGGPFMTTDCGTGVAIDGSEYVSVYDSSKWAERGFCKGCGSHLFYRLKHNQQYMVPVGLFKLEDYFVFDHQVFVDERPSFYCFSNETKDMTGPELFAMYGG